MGKAIRRIERDFNMSPLHDSPAPKNQAEVDAAAGARLVLDHGVLARSHRKDLHPRDSRPLASVGVVAATGVVTGLASTVNGSVSSVMTTAGGGRCCVFGFDMARNAAARFERELSSPKPMILEA
nr:uncharacterized protein LOC119169264 [Rhipicephalus microplus]